MSLELFQLYPNARVTHDGEDGTVLDVNAGTVKLVRDNGLVQEYTYDSVMENATVYEPPEDKPADPTPTPAPAPEPTPAPAPEPTPAPAQPETPSQPSEPSSPAADSRQQTS